DLEPEKSRSGSWTIKWPAQGKGTYIHSRYDPEQEAREMVRPFRSGPGKLSLSWAWDSVTI
ncbi:MAG: hypothetical protein PHF84_12475, partial [bacterium]|nr:hypothetical protein [bacterium]